MSPAPEGPEFPDDPTEQTPPETHIPDWARHDSASERTAPLAWAADPPASAPTPDEPDTTDPASAPRSPSPPPDRPSGSVEDGPGKTQSSAEERGGGAASYPVGGIAPGQVLFGRYRVVRLLGRGGMGAVWLVRHIELDRERALKVICAGHDGDVQARSWFQREARILARVSEHPHAVTVHDARLTDADVAYIDMEYIRGRSLDEILKRGVPMPLDWVARVADQLCEALQYAHDNHILHRDLKPSNLMLVDGRPPGQEQLKVLDFGIGKILNAEDREGGPLTITGGFVGTPPYTSPEQAVGAAETRSDLYSVGVILYELLTGHRPFQGVPALMIHQTIAAPPPSFREVNPKAEVPAEVEAVVLRCLAKRPEDRPESARALAREFRSAHALASPTVVATAFPPSLRAHPIGPTRGRRPGKRMGLAVACVAILAIGGGLAWNFRGLWRAVPSGVDPIRTAHVPVGSKPTAGPPVIPARPPIDESKAKPPEPSVGEPPPVAIAFDPPEAEVVIEGRSVTLDDQGRVELEPGRLPATITARGEGYASFSRTMSLDDLEKVGFRISLEDAPGFGKVLADRAYQILKDRCQGCHGVEFRGRAFDVLDRIALVGPLGDAHAPLVVPGDPERSPLWAVARDGHPAGQSPGALDPKEVTLLRRWVRSGSPFPASDPRPIVTARRELEVIARHLRALPEEDRKYQRFFTLSALRNRDLPPEVRRLAAAALAKAINSLSWQPDLVIPKEVDDAGAVFAVDLRALGWVKGGAWGKILAGYPYGITHTTDADQALRGLAVEVHDLSRSELPVVRGDWFIARATRPPLYPMLLGLPETGADLERRLEIDSRADFLDDELDRSAADASVYARQPRVIDDHSTSQTAFWKAYQARPEAGRKGIFDAPLGPPFEGHPFPGQAFAADASSILFSLPNGLSAFMIVDGDGRRIDELPETLARDPLGTVGSPRVVAGLSCIACHRLGVERFRDVLRARSTLDGAAHAKLAGIMPGAGTLDATFDDQEKRTLIALGRVMGPMLGADRGPNAAIADLPEPIGVVARTYARGLDARAVAAELGIEDAEAPAKELREGGLLDAKETETFAKGGTISREAWEQVFGAVVARLRLGTVKQIFNHRPN